MSQHSMDRDTFWHQQLCTLYLSGFTLTPSHIFRLFENMISWHQVSTVRFGSWSRQPNSDHVQSKSPGRSTDLKSIHWLLLYQSQTATAFLPPLRFANSGMALCVWNIRPPKGKRASSPQQRWQILPGDGDIMAHHEQLYTHTPTGKPRMFNAHRSLPPPDNAKRTGVIWQNGNFVQLIIFELDFNTAIFVRIHQMESLLICSHQVFVRLFCEWICFQVSKWDIYRFQTHKKSRRLISQVNGTLWYKCVAAGLAKQTPEQHFLWVSIA